MNARRRGVLSAAVALAVLGSLACGSHGPKTTPHTLPSGKVIKVISVGQMSFPQSGPALVLSYQTDLKVSQTAELQTEVAEIWQDFQKEADRGKFESAIIMANEVPQGTFIQQGHSNNFVFERKGAGPWQQHTR